MARGEQLQRQWNLLITLQTRGEGVPLRQLAQDFGVSERTIQRDFEVLEELGFPIEFNEDDYGKRFWRLPADFFQSGPLVLGLTEAISLHLASHLFDPLAGTHFADGLRSILKKIRAQLPERSLDHFRGLDQTIYVRRTGMTDYSAHAETIHTLSDAAQTQHTVEITYRALWRGDAYTTRYDPYGLVLYDGDLFLVGHSHRAAGLRIFKVTRITGVTTTEHTFRRPPGFSLEENFRASFGIFQPTGEPVEIGVRFRGPVAALVEERVWHESQRLEWLPGEQTLFESAPEEPDALLATFRLANLVEFKRWIKGYGDMAEIVRPAWLRDEMRAELLAAARQYQT